MAIPELSSLSLVQPHATFEARTVAPQAELEDTNTFGNVLQNVITKTNADMTAADNAAENFATGRVDDIHGTMLAMGKADVQLRLVGSMRNRVVDAFYELWRMQV